MYILYYFDNRYHNPKNPLRKTFNNRRHLINWLKKYCRAFKFYNAYIARDNSHVVMLEIIFK